MKVLIAEMQDRDWRTSTEPYPVRHEEWITFCPHPRDCGHKLGDDSDFDLQYDVREGRFSLTRVGGLCIDLGDNDDDQCPSIYTIEAAIELYVGKK